MFWISLLAGGAQGLFLAQQLFLVGHETTSYYVRPRPSPPPLMND
jgi:hypothetical protein